MISLGEDGLQKVKAGVTAPQELLRVVTEVRGRRTVCSNCGGNVSPDFAACPNCGHGVTGRCVHCQRPMQPSWKFCPYCAKDSVLYETAKPDRAVDPRRKLPELPGGNVAEFKK
jgi:RNA polymerase subunit RPABC4/transcription elongation factor Spt4